MRKRESVNRNERGKDGKNSKGNGEMGILNCKGKMEAKNRRLIERRVIKKIMKKERVEPRKLIGGWDRKKKERVGGNRKRG